MESIEAVEAYYRALDGQDYETLTDVLATEFVHERPDRTLEGRERFVRFMREERPQTDTSHPLDRLYVPATAPEPAPSEGGGSAADTRPEDGSAAAPTEVAARGRLLTADESLITRFVDVFAVADGRLQRLRTYTR